MLEWLRQHQWLCRHDWKTIPDRREIAYLRCMKCRKVKSLGFSWREIDESRRILGDD
jgi:hypothetical protein